MKTEEMCNSVVGQLEKLHQARIQQRTADTEVMRLKAEINSMRVKLAASGDRDALEFASKVNWSEIMSW